MARPFLAPFRRLLRLAGSRWRYSSPPPHGLWNYLAVCLCILLCLFIWLCILPDFQGLWGHIALCVCVSHNCFVFYAVRIISKKSRLLVLPRTSYNNIIQSIPMSHKEYALLPSFFNNIFMNYLLSSYLLGTRSAFLNLFVWIEIPPYD
jgi:hypothetical protein